MRRRKCKYVCITFPLGLAIARYSFHLHANIWVVRTTACAHAANAISKGKVKSEFRKNSILILIIGYAVTKILIKLTLVKSELNVRDSCLNTFIEK